MNGWPIPLTTGQAVNRLFKNNMDVGLTIAFIQRGPGIL